VLFDAAPERAAAEVDMVATATVKRAGDCLRTAEVEVDGDEAEQLATEAGVDKAAR